MEALTFKTVSNQARTQAWRYADIGEGPPVLMVHGFPDTPAVFTELANRIQEQGFRVILPYLRGYHPDTMVEGRPYDPLTLGRDGVGLLDALGVDRASVIGHDWGATVGYGMVANVPQRVSAFVAISIPHATSLRPNVRALWALRHFVHFNLPFAEARTRRSDFAYMMKIARRLNPGASAEQINQLHAEVSQLLSDPTILRGMIDYYRAFSPKIGVEFRQKHPVPYLLVSPDSEAGILGGEPALQRSCDAFNPPGRFVVVPNAGHSPYLDDPDFFLEHVVPFLRANT